MTDSKVKFNSREKLKLGCPVYRCVGIFSHIPKVRKTLLQLMIITGVIDF